MSSSNNTVNRRFFASLWKEVFSMHTLWLVPIGFFVGMYGTLVGLGGGFLIVPLLLLMYPNKDAAFATSISLAVVCVNGLSGSWAYARMKRINYRIGLVLGLGTIPGAVLGTIMTSLIPRRLFELLFGLLLIVLTIFLIKNADRNRQTYSSGNSPSEKENQPSFHLGIALAFSLGVGFLGGLFGVGGGMLFVPFMFYILRFPMHIATATSIFILMITSLSATISHLVSSTLKQGLEQAMILAIGVAIGAQVGARLSSRIKTIWLVRGLALALGLTGLKFVLSAV
jgi:uncharacterized protein